MLNGIDPITILFIVGGLAVAILVIGLVVSIRSDKSNVDQRLDRYLAAGHTIEEDNKQKSAALTDWFNQRVEKSSYGDGISKSLARADLKLKSGEYIAVIILVPALTLIHLARRQGRYAYQRQPEIAHWNLFALGQALLPLIRQPDAALAVLQPFPALFSAELDRRMALKLGLPQASDGSRQLVQALLDLLTRERTDWTIFWRRLARQVAGDLRQPVTDLFHDRAAIDRLLLQYQELLAQSNRAQTADLMLKTNPGLVLRNHLAEQAITLARQHDFSMVQSLHDALQRPFDEQPEHADWCNFPPDWASQIQISCSS